MSTSPMPPITKDDGDNAITLTHINKVVTVGRLVWVILWTLAVLGSGGVGFLLGEGSARATFTAKYEMIEKRVGATEVIMAAERIERAARLERDRIERAQDLEAERKERDRIIEKIGEVGGRIANVEGALKIIAENVKPRRVP